MGSRIPYAGVALLTLLLVEWYKLSTPQRMTSFGLQASRHLSDNESLPYLYQCFARSLKSLSKGLEANIDHTWNVIPGFTASKPKGLIMSFMSH
jgi:hypothetical protein